MKRRPPIDIGFKGVAHFLTNASDPSHTLLPERTIRYSKTSFWLWFTAAIKAVVPFPEKNHSSDTLRMMSRCKWAERRTKGQSICDAFTERGSLCTTRISNIEPRK